MEEIRANAERKDLPAIQIIDEESIKNKIYIIRGVKVMLDFDLAAIYGYTTKAFNQQVKNNSSKFDEDFRFQLNSDEIEQLSRSKILTSIQTKGVKGGRSYQPWCFTEPGIYMLMTVLKGDLAVKQSKALIRAFQSMKNYIIENQGMVGQIEYLKLCLQVSDSIKENMKMRKDLDDLSESMKGVLDKLSDVVLRSEISPILLEMGEPEEKREYLFLNGQPMKADLAYLEIFSKAKRSIHLVDDYINIKTLHMLQDVRKDVTVTIISDNVRNLLRASDLNDFHKEAPDIQVEFIRSGAISHDRFIVLDYKAEEERLFLCGSSSKDAGYRTSSITEFANETIKQAFHKDLEKMLNNSPLVLR